MNENQRTLKDSFNLKGSGLHTGREVTITCHPASENFGWKFKRVDLKNKPVIPALAEFVSVTPRSTILEKDGVQLQTIEHLLAAFYGSKIDNCLFELDAEEPPILDGSAKYFVEAIEKTGILEQKSKRKYFIVDKPYHFKNEQTGSEITLLPDSDFKIDTHIAFDSPYLNNQFASLSNLENFNEEIARCRTFVFFRELEPLLNKGLIKGGDLKNAIVILDKKVPQVEVNRIAKLFGHESKKVNELGVVNDIKLFYKNEPARHKLLDVIGDIALCGRFIKGRVIATRPGHYVNTNMAKIIRKAMKAKENGAPVYNPDKEPLLNINQIKKLLPHRYPFLLVDKVLEITENGIVGLKNVTLNEPFFTGHFPAEPIMPGVLLVEAMAQCGGIFILNGLDEPEKHSTYFVKIDKIKFRKKIVPGDTLILKLTQLTPPRRSMIHMSGKAFVGSKLVAEGEFMAQVIKNK